MKKILIVTRQYISNYGSFLQTFAMQKVIESMGYDVNILNYIRVDEKAINSHKIWAKKHKKGFIQKYLYFCVGAIPNYFIEKGFSKIRNKYLSQTSICHSIKDIKKISNQYDVCISGSDQLWGPIANLPYDGVYFLDFPCKKRIAYSSSFGVTEFQTDDTIYKKMLSNFSKIGVRELTAKKMLETIDIKSDVVLDPTLLVDKSFYLKYAKPIKESKYILYYQIHNNSLMDKYVKIFAEKNNLRIISISSHMTHLFKHIGKFVASSNPFEFVSYIYQADYVISDSFHCTVLAVLLNKKFISFSATNTSSRITDFLQYINLRNHFVNDLNDFETLKENIDYKKIEQLIEKDRIRCKKLLEEWLED